jgi:hypothetical protein
MVSAYGSGWPDHMMAVFRTAWKPACGTLISGGQINDFIRQRTCTGMEVPVNGKRRSESSMALELKFCFIRYVYWTEPVILVDGFLFV